MATDFSFSAYLRPTNDDDDGCGENRAVVAAAAPGDLELSIFDARKYFTETSIDPIPCATKKISQPVPRFSTDSSVDGFSRSYRTRLYRSCATPTASSEASWNSHTGLLSNPPGAIPVSLRNPASDRKSGSRCSSPRWLLFLRECPCSSKKSVQVQKTSSESRSPASRNNCSPKLGEAAISKIKLDNSTGKVTSKPELFVENMQNIVLDAHTRFSNEGFTFPVLNPSTSSSSLPFNRKLLIHDFPPKTASAVIASLPLPLTEDPPRDSLEVFQPSGTPPDIRRKSRDAISFPVSPRRRINSVSVDNDIMSDASSDLFEIESFSMQSNSTSYPAVYARPRDSLDEARPRFSTAASGGIYGCLDGPTAAAVYDTTTECGYEPSEASITWSVNTAEGTAFDHASVTNYSVSASDVEEFTRIQLRQHKELERSGGGVGGGGGKRRGGGGGLLTSCRCEKAVSVGPNPVKYTTDKGHVAARAGRGVITSR
ncbi:hypothetical protein CDL15_Pgr001248 [Punica granatum]|nr:hypothetical protein CDL15_Pgr001248 [Punica granatum]